jgi:hypothetical protein
MNARSGRPRNDSLGGQRRSLTSGRGTVTPGIEERISIAAPPAPVWGLLIEPRSWNRWWPAVRFARSLDFKPLHEASRFEITLELGRLTSTLRPRVELCADGRSLAWRGRWLGVALRQEWFLDQRPAGVRVTARTAFSGPPAALLRLARLDRRWQGGLAEALRGLKHLAERMG